MKHLLSMYVILTIVSVYTIAQFNEINSNISTNTVQIHENKVLLQENSILTNAIRQEQNRRTENVYTVPYLKTKLETSAPTVKSGILKTDMAGNILEASPGIYSIVWLTPEQAGEESMIGKSISVLMDDQTWARHQEILKDGNFGDDVLMNRVVPIRGKKVQVSASYLKTEKVFIINMKEI